MSASWKFVNTTTMAIPRGNRLRWILSAIREAKGFYIQSAFALPSPEKTEQELRPLRNIPDSFKKIVIVKDDILVRRNEEGIVTMGLKQFLLDEHSLEV